MCPLPSLIGFIAFVIHSFLISVAISRVTRRWHRFQKHDRAEQRGTTRNRRIHRDLGHVWIRGSKAKPAGALVHQSMRRDDATLLQHAYIQELDRELPRRGYTMRRGGRLRR